MRPYYKPDPAASYAIARSLDDLSRAEAYRLQISGTYAGGDEFLRQAVRVGAAFEAWACRNVDFDALGEVWPYYVEGFAGWAESCDFTPLDLEKLTRASQFRSIAERAGLPLLKPSKKHSNG
jgi:hypothetical protein